MPDIFDIWFKSLPKERHFSKTKVPEKYSNNYNIWKQKYGLEETPDYDLAGAFLSGQTPDRNRHLGSFGLNGKLLKHPKHETAWKTAFTEIYNELMGVYPVIDDDMTREEAAEIANELYKYKGMPLSR